MPALTSIFNHHENEDAGRKFIDLIYIASSAFPNWDPSRKVEPGDFGRVDRKTGQFIKEGSIYTHEVCAAIAAPYPVVVREVDECKHIISLDAKDQGCEVGPQTSVTGLGEAYIKAKVQFGERRGAALFIYKPKVHYLNPELVAKIEEDEKCIKLMKHKLMITDVFQASSYAMYLSPRQAETVEIVLLADAPVQGGPGLASSCRWWCSSSQGTFEHTHNTSNGIYPLYIHKQLKWKGRRESPDPYRPDAGFGFLHSDLPWNPLREDGDEVMYEPSSDEVTSDEEDGMDL